MLTKPVFMEQMAALSEAIGKEKLTPEKVRIYWRFLSTELTDEQMIRAVDTLAKTATFFPAIAEIRAAAGIRDILKLYRKAGNGKCVCGLEISYPESQRRGYCNVCWRKVKEQNRFTDDDEQQALGNVPKPDKPPQLPRSGRGPERITGSDFDA